SDMPTEETLYSLALYAASLKCVLVLKEPWRDRLFALINLAGVMAIFYWQPNIQLYWQAFTTYGAFVCAQFAFMRFCFARGGRMATAPFLSPIAFLILVKYFSLANLAPAAWGGPQITIFLGLSYLSFRLSLLPMEARSGVVAPPTFSRYMGYAFFMPIML